MIMEKLDTKRARNLVVEMRTMASEIRDGITKYAIISHPLFGAMYAFEVDGTLSFSSIYFPLWSPFMNPATCRGSICSEGMLRTFSAFPLERMLTATHIGYGSQNLMDDANLPSLLSIPMMDYATSNRSTPGREEVYLNTRLFALSEENPYWMHGPVMSAIGGPHIGPTKAWPLASIVRVLTSEDEGEIRTELQGLVGSTDGLGEFARRSFVT